jgi:hypothetical protein
MTKAEWRPAELYPRVGFIVTNMNRPAERVVAFYNGHRRAMDPASCLIGKRSTTGLSTPRSQSALCTSPGRSAQRSRSPNWLNTNSG